MIEIPYNNDVARIINLENGAEKELSIEGWSFGEYVDWASDGKGLFMDAKQSSSIGCFRS